MASVPGDDDPNPAPTHVQGSGTQAGQRTGSDRVVVVTPDGMAVSGGSDPQDNPALLIEQPAKVMRIGSMIKQLLEEVRSAPLDEAGRARLAEIHERSLAELEKGLAPELADELRAMAPPLDDTQTPSDAELRIAQAQLVGWLEGLFHGIQTALFAQQVAARSQLEQMRRALPGQASPDLQAAPDGTGAGGGTGQYL